MPKRTSEWVDSTRAVGCLCAHDGIEEGGVACDAGVEDVVDALEALDGVDGCAGEGGGEEGEGGVDGGGWGGCGGGI